MTRSTFDRRVHYMAHPLAGDVSGNKRRALEWLRFLRLSVPEVTIIAPWLAAIDASGATDDGDVVSRELGLLDCVAVVARCDGLILCGGRISPGMRRELAIAEARDLDVDDLTPLGTDAPRALMPHVLEGILPRSVQRQLQRQFLRRG